MKEKRYDILLDNKKLGTTELEKADAPMGVVFGNIEFYETLSGYDFFKNYCQTKGIEIMSDYPEDRFIATSNIPQMKVINPNGIEISALPGLPVSFPLIPSATLGVFFKTKRRHIAQCYFLL